MMRFLRRSLVGLFLLSLTLGLLAWAGQIISSSVNARMEAPDRSRPAAERVFAANVVRAEPGEVTPELTAFGEVRSRRTLEIRAPAAGTLQTLNPAFEDGGLVVAGELLFQVDPAVAQSALDRARMDVVEAEADLADASRSLELAREDVTAAEEQAALRLKALERQTDLRTRGAGTRGSVEDAELAESSARQSLLSKRQGLAQAEARLTQAESQTSRAAIGLAEAERNLADTSLQAEFDGTLGQVTAVEGGLVSQNEKLAVLTDPNALEVSFRVSTAQYARLLGPDGQLTPAAIRVSLDVAGLDLTAEGRISRESASVGEGQTGRLLFARLEAAPGFRPGDFVTVTVSEPPLRFAIRLPATAVDAAGTVLVLGEEDRLELAQVELLRRQGDDVLVRSREVAGRDVVAERTPLLGAGIKIRPLRPGASTEPEAPAMVQLDPERRAKLVAFVEGNARMPAEAKARILGQLEKDQVPARMVERIESRMGG